MYHNPFDSVNFFKFDSALGDKGTTVVYYDGVVSGYDKTSFIFGGVIGGTRADGKQCLRYNFRDKDGKNTIVGSVVDVVAFVQWCKMIGAIVQPQWSYFNDVTPLDKSDPSVTSTPFQVSEASPINPAPATHILVKKENFIQLISDFLSKYL